MNGLRTLRLVTDDYKVRPLSERMALEERDWVTTQEIVQETGASFRKIDYWIRTGLIHARGLLSPGSGSVRRFDLSELERARAVAALADAGIDFGAIREHLDHLIQHGGYQIGAVTVLYTPDPTT